MPQVYTTSSGTIIAPGAWQLPGFPGQSRTFADLYYNRHRDYDPSTGRYIQADPIGLDGDVNPYVYAGANPVTGIDPEGLATAGAAIGGAIGHAVGGANGAIAGGKIGSRVEDALFPKPDQCPVPDKIHRSKCQPHYDAINATVGWIQRKELQQANGRPEEVPGHHKAILGYAKNLLGQVKVAKGKKCFNFNPDARQIIYNYLGIVV